MTWILATIAAVMSTQVAEETITLAPKNCRVTAYENAAELATVQSGEVKRIALKLSQSTNVVALLTEAGEARERAFVRVTFASLKDMPDECGPWLAGSPNAAGWLTSAEPPPGFRPVQVHQSQLEVPAGQCAFRQLIAKPPAAPPWFPKMDVAYAVLGTRQLIKPYLPDLGIPFAYDYQLVLGLPEGIRPAACDGGVGAKPNAIQTVAVGKRVFANLHYSDPPGSPFGIYICWGDSNKATISYQPVLHIGGTYNWRRLSAAVTAPPNAAYAHPIVLKWAGDKVVGEAWIDNVVLRAADDETKQNLLSAGDFEGEVWKGVGAIEKAGPDGSHCLHATLPADRIGETRGWWIPPEVKTPVAGGKNYVLEADVRAER
ncbi:MAG: hypothetical protein H5T86_07480, partial [Armatimonadetes bacterium]|nr:hypothetical protein [Armatimonadota bacterium]